MSDTSDRLNILLRERLAEMPPEQRSNRHEREERRAIETILANAKGRATTGGNISSDHGMEH